MTITLRTESDPNATTKNAALSFSELDNNFIDLLKRSQEYISGDNGVLFTHGSDGSAIAELQFLGAGGNTAVVTSDSAGKIVVTLTSNISNETSPTLGANLALNGNKITNTGGNINLEMDATTGALELDSGIGINLKAANKIFTTTTNGSIKLTPNGTGTVTFEGSQTWSPSSNVDANYSTLTNYLEGYSLPDTQSALGVSGDFTIDPTSGNNHYIVLSGSATFKGFTNEQTGQRVNVFIDGLTFGPGLTATFNEFDDATVLTNGGGSLVTGGGIDIVEILCFEAGDSGKDSTYVVLSRTPSGLS